MRDSLWHYAAAIVFSLGTGCASTMGSAPDAAPERAVSLPPAAAPRDPAGEVDDPESDRAVVDSTPTRETETFRVYFPDREHPDWSRSCGAVTNVERSIPSTEYGPDAVLRALLAGPSPRERERGLMDPYEPLAKNPGTSDRLGAFFQGVDLDGQHAAVRFSRPALDWLNSAACQQESVKIPIETTLREVFGVEDVSYVIDGSVFDEWDA